MDAILKTVYDLASGGEKSAEISPLSFLYGYAKLISMDKGVLDSLFSDEATKKELDELRFDMSRSEINFDLLKKTISVLRSIEADEFGSSDYRNALEAIREEKAEISAGEMLSLLIEEDPRELVILRHDADLDDVFYYVDLMKKCSEADYDELPDDDEAMDDEVSETAPKRKLQSDSFSDSKNGLIFEKSKKTIKEGREDFRRIVEQATELQQRLLTKIKGQSEAVRVFSKGFFQSEVLKEAEEPKGPGASFLFAGPPGVGKTYFALTAAEILKRPFLRLDMSEYTRDSSVHRLTGTPKTYSSPSKGTMTGFVSQNPKPIILLDEIEKAHPDVIYQFLQVLDSGVITDGFTGDSVFFYDAILIFTTNAGTSLYEDENRQNLSSLPMSVIRNALVKDRDMYGKPLFPEAIVSRFFSGNVVMFNHLSVHHLTQIAESRFAEYGNHVKECYGYDVDFDEKLGPMLIYNQGMGADARGLSALSERVLKDELREFGQYALSCTGSLERLESVHFKVQIPEEDEIIRKLFIDEESSLVLIFGEKDYIEDVPFGMNCKVEVVSDREGLLKRVSNEDVSYVLIDPYYGSIESEQIYLSLDDKKSEGVFAFEKLSETLPQVPIYMLENSPIKDEDKYTFEERGVRGFLTTKDKVAFADRVAKLCRQTYLQKKVDDLAGRGKVLKFNTRQNIYNYGKEVDLTFYDFRIEVAADESENSLLLSDHDRPKELFSDVIGAENAKSELSYFIEFMKNPKKYMADSSKLPKGILLYGPPGTGKTMLARAMAGECDVSFFAAAATDFANKYVGESERKIRELFKVAKKFAPSIIFIDEIDAIGKERTGSESTHHSEKQLNTLLTEMDGFNVNPSRPVFVIAATNFDIDGTKSGKQSKLDPALMRRFDNRIYVDLPKEKERMQYLQLLREKSRCTEISDDAIKSIASRTIGQSPAILKNIFELALRNARKQGRKPTGEDLLTAHEEYMYGEKKEFKEDSYESTAIHESGHAYIYHLSGKKASYVTIVGRGGFGGYMQHENEEDVLTKSKEELLWDIRTSLAGRVAEMEFFGEESGVNTGASSDLKNATNTAMNMICRYGMIGDGLVSLSPDKVLNSPGGAELIRKTNQLLDEQMDITKKLIHEGRDSIRNLADFLLENNQATEEEIVRVFSEEK